MKIEKERLTFSDKAQTTLLIATCEKPMPYMILVLPAMGVPASMYVKSLKAFL